MARLKPRSKLPSPKSAAYLLPSLMTAGNLFCGFMAVLQIIQGSLLQASSENGDWIQPYETSLLWILGAFIFDMLDGRLARLGGHESAFGREFDSLADVISFGIAPALLVFKIVLAELPARIGWMIAFVYLVCGAMRLARFNSLTAQPDPGNRAKDFTGFPIPAAAGLVASVTLLLLQYYESDRVIGDWKYLLAGLLLFLSFMMFSKVRYPSFKTIDWRTQRPVPRMLLIVAIFALIVQTYRFSLAILFTGYLVYGFIRPHLSRKWRHELEDGKA
ncbi:MAG: CDP-diacylglycerol--serine O-phosphatidyltransferase [Verrucomicrobia bacterium]|nr:CDP-diacylglycerol--serine O-phosphatidyltransferase [Verrucomicrobiota bacterium]NDA25541.1 CDP-diacylglycerol--serine O-phosphatidyltransferase [Verrucomicrobiota bacterium]